MLGEFQGSYRLKLDKALNLEEMSYLGAGLTASRLKAKHSHLRLMVLVIRIIRRI